MRLLKALSLFAALMLLGGAVLDAQTGALRAMLGAAPDGGAAPGNAKKKKNAANTDTFMHATKSGPLVEPREPEPTPQQAVQQAAPEPKRDAGK